MVVVVVVVVADRGAYLLTDDHGYLVHSRKRGQVCRQVTQDGSLAAFLVPCPRPWLCDTLAFGVERQKEGECLWLFWASDHGATRHKDAEKITVGASPTGACAAA